MAGGPLHLISRAVREPRSKPDVSCALPLAETVVFLSALVGMWIGTLSSAPAPYPSSYLHGQLLSGL